MIKTQEKGKYFEERQNIEHPENRSPKEKEQSKKAEQVLIQQSLPEIQHT